MIKEVSLKKRKKSSGSVVNHREEEHFDHMKEHGKRAKRTVKLRLQQWKSKASRPISTGVLWVSGLLLVDF